MDRRHLPLNALRSFEVAARHRVFTRAAEELGVTHGAVSRQVAALERALDVQLFVRTGRTLALTPAGHALLGDVSGALDRLALALTNVARRRQGVGLAVDAPPTFTMKWLIPRLPAFQRRHPEIDVRLTTGVGPPDASRLHDHDVVIRRLPRGRTSAPGAFLAASLVPACAPEVVERGTLRNPRDLARHTLLTATTNRTAWQEWFAQAGVRRPPARRELLFDEMYLAMQAALDGLGIALLPVPLIADDLRRGRLVTPWCVPGLLTRDYCSMLSPAPGDPGSAAQFVRWLHEEGVRANRETQRLTRRLAAPGAASMKIA